MTECTIQPAEREDLEAITSLVAAAYAPARAELADLPDVTAGFADHLAQDIVLKAVLNDTICGVIVLAPRDGSLWIINLAVDPEFGGHGIGQQLMQRAQSEAFQHQCKDMRLRTHAGMDRTLAFYRRLGWEETGRSGAAVTMRKTLPVRG